MITKSLVIVTFLCIIDLDEVTDHEVQNSDLDDSNARRLGVGDPIHFSTRGTWMHDGRLPR